MAKTDPLATALDNISRGSGGGTMPKLVQLFGDRPAVLESVLAARRDRRLSWSQIAKKLSEDGVYVSPGAVQNWANQQGVD